LINSLSQLPQLRVIARTTVFRYKGQDVEPQKVGQELGVDAVLTGEVKQRGDILIIQVDLIDVGDGSQIWGEQYQYQLADVLSLILNLQDRIAEQISEKLLLKLTGQERKLLTRRYTSSSEAYQAYLKGRYHWNKRIESGFKKAIGYFNQAIANDPNYAHAYAGLADTYVLLSWYSVMPPRDAFPQAKIAAARALKLDDRLAEAYTSMAFIKSSYDWDWEGAEHEYKRAIELNPGYATAHQWYSLFLAAMGRHEEAIAAVERAHELDPLSLVINRDCGWVTYWARQYDQSIKHYFRTFELEPHFYIAHYFLGEVYEQKGDSERAIAEFHQTKTHPEWTTRVWTLLAHARAFALTGERKKADAKLNELTGLSPAHYVSPYLIATVYSQLRDKDEAFSWLQKALEERDSYLIYLKVEPALDPLRTDSRFTELLSAIGLE
jgi:tetratricopeptide (TPR) repeat protein